MYRKSADFIEDWTASAAGTRSVMQAITNDKMNFAIVEGHNTLGWLAWHLVNSTGFFGHVAGLQIPAPGREVAMPSDMAEIIQHYDKVVDAFKNQAATLTDEMLTEKVDGFGAPLERGKVLRTLVDHQTHHRGQMTVLLRQAGLTVPGIMGPTKEMQKA